MSTAGTVFRLFGFPVHVRAGFFLFMVLIVAARQRQPSSASGWPVHSPCSRCSTSSVTPSPPEPPAPRPRSRSTSSPATRRSCRRDRSASAGSAPASRFAGPAVQIVVSLAVLLAMGVNPLDPRLDRRLAATLAIWWAGPVIGLFNLHPGPPARRRQHRAGRSRPARRQAVAPSWMLYFSLADHRRVRRAVRHLRPARGLFVFVGFLLVTPAADAPARRRSRRDVTVGTTPVVALAAGQGTWQGPPQSSISRH